ncbi:MAG: MFS transporter [Bacteroidota bacterium]
MSSKRDTFLVLKNRDFRLFITGRLVMTIATQIQSVIVGWQLFKLTGDPLSLGFIGLAEALPFFVVSLYAGHVADIISRRKIILFCVSILFFCGLALTYFSMDMNVELLLNTRLPIYFIIGITGLARGFITPANFAFMPQLIERKDYSKAISWSSTAWQTGAVAGPAMSGIIFGFSSFRTTYLIVSGLILLSFVLYLLIPSRPVPPHNPDIGMKVKILEGLQFVFSNQIILGALCLDLFAVLFGGAVALLPVFAKEILNVGAEGLGILRAAPAIGAIVMAIFLAYRPMQQNAGKKLLWSVAGFGACMISFALSKNFILSFSLLLLSGIFDSVSIIIRSTLIHTLTPENMKGRVSAVNSIFIGSSNEIGAFESGVAAKLMNTIPSVIFGGCMTILVVIITATKAKKLFHLNLSDKE